MRTTWSSAVLEGKKREDRILAVRRAWPTLQDTPQASPHTPQTPLGQASPSRRSPSGSSTSSGSSIRPPTYHLFAVFDGHDGADAAHFAAHSLLGVVEALMQPWDMLASQQAAAEGPPELAVAAHVQEVLVVAFLELQRLFASTGLGSGCTATAVLQLGRLVTVAGAGSSRCLLDTGGASLAALPLSVDHVIGCNLGERQRLLAGGCRVAAMDVSGLGPAASPCRGSGVLRLWPGGLTLSRSIGDFKVGRGVLPVPHVKQVLLPASGGRLVLATDGVWSCWQEGEGVLSMLRSVPLKTAAHATVKAVNTSRNSGVDASIIVADVLPGGDSFQDLCRRQEAQHTQQAAAAASRPAGGRGRSMLSLFGLGRSKSTSALEQGGAALQQAQQRQQSQVQQQPAARPWLVADFDAAALLGLGCEADNRQFLLRDARPPWFHELLKHELLGSLEEAWQVWHLVRRRMKAAELVAAVSEADLLERYTSRSESDLQWLEAAATAAEAAAAAETAAGGRWAAAGTLQRRSSPDVFSPPLAGSMSLGAAGAAATTSATTGAAAAAAESGGAAGGPSWLLPQVLASPFSAAAPPVPQRLPAAATATPSAAPTSQLPPPPAAAAAQQQQERQQQQAADKLAQLFQTGTGTEEAQPPSPSPGALHNQRASGVSRDSGQGAGPGLEGSNASTSSGVSVSTGGTAGAGTSGTASPSASARWLRKQQSLPTVVEELEPMLSLPRAEPDPGNSRGGHVRESDEESVQAYSEKAESVVSGSGGSGGTAAGGGRETAAAGGVSWSAGTSSSLPIPGAARGSGTAPYRRVSFSGAAAGVGTGGLEPLTNAYRRLPPLRKPPPGLPKVAAPASPAASAVSPALSAPAATAATPAWPPHPLLSSLRTSSTATVHGTVPSRRPPLPRVASGSSSGSGSSSSNLRALGPDTPRASFDDDLPSSAAAAATAAASSGSQRRRAVGDLVGSPDTKWRTAYSLTAGIFTTAGSGYHHRRLPAGPGPSPSSTSTNMSALADAYSQAALTFVNKPRRSSSTKSF